MKSLFLILMLFLICNFNYTYGEIIMPRIKVLMLPRCHMCHDPFIPRDHLVLVPEDDLIKMERVGEFRIYTENTFRSPLQDVELLVESPAFDIEVKPRILKRLIPGERTFFLVKLKLKEGYKLGDYPLRIRVKAREAVLRPSIEKIGVVVSEEVPLKALFLIAEGFHDMETFIPMSRLKEEHIEVTVGGIDIGKYKAGYGSPHTLDVEIAARDIKIEGYNALIIPGGKSPAILRKSEEILVLVREAHRQGKIIAAICHGPQVLISAGILKGKRATAVGGVKDELLEAGAKYINEEVVRDGNIITSRVPTDLPAFCRALILALKEEETVSEAGTEDAGEVVVQIVKIPFWRRPYFYLVLLGILLGLILVRKLKRK